MLGADDVGARVVVRHRLDAPDPATGATLTDVLGTLVAVDAAGLTVRRADGGEVTVALAAVRAARRVPERPAPRPR